MATAAGHGAAAGGHTLAQAASVAGHGAATGAQHLASGAAGHGVAMGTGAAVAAGTAGRGVLGQVFGNPWVTLVIGAVVGYYGYKHRKEIKARVQRVADSWPT